MGPFDVPKVGGSPSLSAATVVLICSAGVQKNLCWNPLQYWYMPLLTKKNYPNHFSLHVPKNRMQTDTVFKPPILKTLKNLHVFYAGPGGEELLPSRHLSPGNFWKRHEELKNNAWGCWKMMNNMVVSWCFIFSDTGNQLRKLRCQVDSCCAIKKDSLASTQLASSCRFFRWHRSRSGKVVSVLWFTDGSTLFLSTLIEDVFDGSTPWMFLMAVLFTDGNTMWSPSQCCHQRRCVGPSAQQKRQMFEGKIPQIWGAVLPGSIDAVLKWENWRGWNGRHLPLISIDQLGNLILLRCD